MGLLVIFFISQKQSPLPVPPPPVPECIEDSWECGEWGVCLEKGLQLRECKLVDDCPGVETPKPFTQRSCTPQITYSPFLQHGYNVSINPSCNPNQFTVGFVLITPDTGSQETEKTLFLLQKLRNDFREYFYEATYKLARATVSDIFMTTKGAEDASNGNVNMTEAIKELISTKGDKFDFVAIFTTYDYLNDNQPNQYFFRVKNNIKNIGLEIFDNSSLYGSSGKLKGFSFHDDIMFKLCDKIPIRHGIPCGIGELLHELGHYWCCYIGDNFTGNNDEKIGIIDGAHFYIGLDTYPSTADPLGASHWIPNDDGTYRPQTVVFGGEGNIVRYHPIFLYLMGLLPEYEYDTKFQVFKRDVFDINQGTRYRTVSVRDIIEVMGERNCEK